GLASPAQVRSAIASGEAYDAKLWRAMAEQGWMGIDVPERRGGLGLGFVEAAVLLEEVGRHAAPAPFLSTLLATGALCDAHEVPEATAWLEPLLAGDAVGCVTWASRPGVIRAEPAGAGFLLFGGSDPVVAAPAADVA